MGGLAELIPEAKSFSRADNLRLIQLLGEELATDEANDINANHSFAVWPPDSEFGAADVKLRDQSSAGDICVNPQ